VNLWALWCGRCRIEQPYLNAVHALLPDTEVVLVLVDVNIKETQANAQVHLAEFGVPYPPAFNPVNEFVFSFDGIGARTIPSGVFVDKERRAAARVLGLTDAREMVPLAGVVFH
jgi:thiol-disulfide isomerase/thioredoxin